MRVPVATTGEIVGGPHEAIGLPRDDVRQAGLDGEPATGAYVGLHGGARGEGLHVPFTVTTALDAVAAHQHAAEVEFRLVVARTSARTV